MKGSDGNASSVRCVEALWNDLPWQLSGHGVVTLTYSADKVALEWKMKPIQGNVAEDYYCGRSCAFLGLFPTSAFFFSRHSHNEFSDESHIQKLAPLILNGEKGAM
jgi:hypothetical protein